jgi:hypothetical protein
MENNQVRKRKRASRKWQFQRSDILFGLDKRFLCQASLVLGLVFLHEHLAEVIAKYQYSLKQESKANDVEFFIAT